MKKLLSFFVALCVAHFAFAQDVIECKSIAEIKAQPNNTVILYTGLGETTIYHGDYNGLFMEDATGGILIKGYTSKGKDTDYVKAGMRVTNIKATWKTGSATSISGITVASADKKTPIIIDGPLPVTMEQFFTNKDYYEGRAVLISDAKISPKVNSKYYLVYEGDSLNFQPSNVASTAPAGGEMSGVFVGLEYNRFILCSPEYIKATEFYSFTDMSAFYKGNGFKNIEFEIPNAKIGGAVLVNYVMKQNDTTIVFAQYANSTGLLNNGIVLYVKGDANIAAGDSIDGFFGQYTDVYKDTKFPYDYADFKGAYFHQAEGSALNIRSSNNSEAITTGVNIADLKTYKTSFNYASQVITSRYAGNLFAEGDGYKFAVSYEISNPDENEDGFITVNDTIAVVGANGLDLSAHVANDVVIAGVYDARVIYDEPTIIIRSEKDILQKYYEYATIADMHVAGEPLSTEVKYALTGEVVVNYKRTQNNSGKQTWVFVEDATGVIALDFGNRDFAPSVGDKIKGLVGTYDDGVRYGFDRTHAPIFIVSEDANIEVVSSGNELNVLQATLGEVIQDTMKYCSRIVEITNFVGTFQHISDLTGERDDYYLYDKTNPELEMHYTPALHTGNAIIGENYILKGLVNFNCLDGYYVVYRIELTEDPNVTVDTEEAVVASAKVYSENGTLFVESLAGETIEVYTVDGKLAYSTTATSTLTTINNLSGALVVKVGQNSYKAIVK